MDDDEYWNTSEAKTKALSFDDDVLSPQEILAIGQGPSLTPSNDTENVFGGTVIKRPLLPLSSLVSSKVLDVLILAQSGTDLAGKEKQTESPDTVPTTLRRLVLGRPCSLHVHRSMKTKTELLNGAVSIGDGNVILTVVLFLIQTLSKKLVYELLSVRPLALNQYISFLQTEGKISELVELLTMQGRGSEAAICKFQHIVKTQGNDVDSLLRKLDDARANHFNEPGIENKMVASYIKLLEWQKCVNNSDLNNKSTLQCLAYCCANHWNEGAGKMMSPLTLCQQQQITPQQYDWVVLNIHATLKNWDIVESLFTRKDWLGRSTMSTNIPLPTIIRRLSELSASKQLLASFINKIGNTEERLEIAKQFKVHSIVIDALAKQRDRSALTNFKMTLNPQSEDYFLAENTLRDPVIKWKN